MSYKLTGVIKVLHPTVQVSDKFSKREFVVTDNTGMYPQDIQFQATQDKCSMLDGLNVGQQVEVSFNIRGREWINPQGEAKYFNSLEAWRVEGSINPVSNMQPPLPTSTPSEPLPDDDLPF